MSVLFVILVWNLARSLFLAASAFLDTHWRISTLISLGIAFAAVLWKIGHYLDGISENIDNYLKQKTIGIEEREESFKIVQPHEPYLKLERKEKDDVWKDFIYSCLLKKPAVYWVFGAKRVGKSTLVEKNAFNLQQQIIDGEIPNIDEYDWVRQVGPSKFKVFYINLEEECTTRKRANEYIINLQDQIKKHERDGSGRSLVVVGKCLFLF